jgi:hypothetical protein
MPQSDSFMGRLDLVVGRLLTGLWRGLLAVLGMAVVLALLVLGIVLSLVLIVWALLRGRRPTPMRFHWSGMGQGMTGRRARAAPPPSNTQAEVVDVEVREITDTPPRDDHRHPR